MALSVRREGYYNWLKRPDRSLKDKELLSALKQARKAHPKYGVKGLIDALDMPKKPSYGKVYKLCGAHDLLVYRRRKPKGITECNEEDQLSEDLVHRDFKADEANHKWLADITEMKCKDGKLYLAAVLDCYDGAIVGMSMAGHKKAELCVAALNSAVSRFGKTKEMIFHSDRGSQYTSKLFRSYLRAYDIKQSMGRTGSCFDNARMESFFATLKKGLVYDLPLYRLSRDEVRFEIFQWIETYYNTKRRYTANEGNLPPLKKRFQHLAMAV